MDIVSERIRELIEELGLSNKDFADAIEVSPAIISHVLSGRNRASLHLIQQITNVYTNVNLDYLLNGNGSMFKSTKANSTRTPKEEPKERYFHEGVRQVAPPGSTPLPHQPQAKSKADAAPEAKENGLTNVYTNVNPETGARAKKIERVIIFYSDKSMEEYRP